MRLLARCLPEYFALLRDGKKHEFRQIESILIENTATQETKTYLVEDIIRLDHHRASQVKENYNLVPWNPVLPVFAIKLGAEINIRSVQGLQEGEKGERDDSEGKFEFFNQRRRNHEYR